VILPLDAQSWPLCGSDRPSLPLLWESSQSRFWPP